MGTFFNGECNEGRDYFLYFFSEVWLCWDLTEKKFVALKVVKSASHYTGFAILSIGERLFQSVPCRNCPGRDQVVEMCERD